MVVNDSVHDETPTPTGPVHGGEIDFSKLKKNLRHIIDPFNLMIAIPVIFTMYLGGNGITYTHVSKELCQGKSISEVNNEYQGRFSNSYVNDAWSLMTSGGRHLAYLRYSSGWMRCNPDWDRK